MKEPLFAKIAAALLLIPLAPMGADVLQAPIHLIAAHATPSTALSGTVKQFTQQAAAPGHRDFNGSIQSPVSWLIAEDQCTEVYDAHGKKLFYGSHPTLRPANGASAQLSRALDTWNKSMAKSFEMSSAPVLDTINEAQRSGQEVFGAPYFDMVTISAWGRVDKQMISFFLDGASYSGGAHPISTAGAVNLDAATGREIALDEIVVGREELLTALIDAFRTQYPGREKETYENSIDAQLEQIHPIGEGLTGFTWYMGDRGELIVHYPAYTLAPYASGSFTITVTRTDAPRLFTDAYPMK